jgi:hypothetical protein
VISDFGFRILDFRTDFPPTGNARLIGVGGTVYGGGAIFDIVGYAVLEGGGIIRANNVKGGSSREARAETSRVPGNLKDRFRYPDVTPLLGEAT